MPMTNRPMSNPWGHFGPCETGAEYGGVETGAYGAGPVGGYAEGGGGGGGGGLESLIPPGYDMMGHAFPCYNKLPRQRALARRTGARSPRARGKSDVECMTSYDGKIRSGGLGRAASGDDTESDQ